MNFAQKELQNELSFLLDKNYILWYNIIRKGKGKSQTPERNLIMDKKEFEAWIDSRLDSFAQVLPEKRRPWVDMGLKLQDRRNYLLNYINAYIGNFFIHCDLVTKETTIFNTASKRSATAKCHMGEVFSVRDGVAIAWAKYNHEDIPSREKLIHREELVSGDKFISSLYDKRVNTFVGWLPNTANGSVGKYAAIVNENGILLKTQIKEQVKKIN